MRKMFRGVVAVEKLVVLGGFAVNLVDGPWGRSIILRWARRDGEARLTGLSGESGDGAVNVFRGRDGVLPSARAARGRLLPFVVITRDGVVTAEDRPPPTKLVMPLSHDRCRF